MCCRRSRSRRHVNRLVKATRRKMNATRSRGCSLSLAADPFPPPSLPRANPPFGCLLRHLPNSRVIFSRSTLGELIRTRAVHTKAMSLLVAPSNSLAQSTRSSSLAQTAQASRACWKHLLSSLHASQHRLLQLPPVLLLLAATFPYRGGRFALLIPAAKFSYRGGHFAVYVHFAVFCRHSVRLELSCADKLPSSRCKWRGRFAWRGCSPASALGNESRRQPTEHVVLVMWPLTAACSTVLATSCMDERHPCTAHNKECRWEQCLVGDCTGQGA
mmetsp:Transcript_913/g.1533  ORF Transcript_913/g.1533 Transcript_913/m.1533 type:complete len:273 (-) Transcript_913:329-1147(-)